MYLKLVPCEVECVFVQETPDSGGGVCGGGGAQSRLSLSTG